MHSQRPQKGSNHRPKFLCSQALFFHRNQIRLEYLKSVMKENTRKEIQSQEVPATSPRTPNLPPEVAGWWFRRPAARIRRFGIRFKWMVETFPDGTGTALLALIALIVTYAGPFDGVREVISEFVGAFIESYQS